MGLFPPSMPRARSSDPLRHAATASLVAAVAGTTLWLGGAPPGAAVLAVLLSTTALGLLVAADQGRLVVPPLALLPLSVAGLCVLQLVPLPPALAGVLSPPLGELRTFALVPLGLDGWRPLSFTWRMTACRPAAIPSPVNSRREIPRIVTFEAPAAAIPAGATAVSSTWPVGSLPSTNVPLS